MRLEVLTPTECVGGIMELAQVFLHLFIVPYTHSLRICYRNAKQYIYYISLS